MAAVMAHKGHTVIGVDVKPAYVEAIQQGRSPVKETGLAEMIQANRARLSATLDCEEAVLASDITFIMVPTPSNPDGMFSMRYVLSAAEKIGAALRKKTDWHLVTLSSTVMPDPRAAVFFRRWRRIQGRSPARISAFVTTRSSLRWAASSATC